MSRRKQPHPTPRPAASSGDERHAPRRGKHGPKPARGTAQGGGDVYLYGFHAVLAALENPERAVERLLFTRNAETELARQGVSLPISPEITDTDTLSAMLP